MGTRDWLVKAGVLKPSEETDVASTQSEPEVVAPTKRSRREKVEEEVPEQKSSVQVDESSMAEIRKMLLQALKKAAQEAGGFSYWNFRTVLDKVSKTVQDEASQYAAAGAAASSMKVDASALVESAKEFLAVLDKEQEKFDADMADSHKSTAADEAELKSIQKQISALQARQEVLNKQVAEANEGHEAGEIAFTTAHSELAGEIKDHIAKIKKYV